MGTTLTGTTPQDTYDSLIKVTDNGPLSGTAKYLSDGLGNDSILALSTTAVGVGTSSPATALHIANASNAVVRAEGTATSGESTFQLLGKNSSGTARSAIFKYDNSDLIRIGVSQAVDMRFETNDTERMRITSAGNVGIGTDAPSTTLHLDASGGATIRLQRTSASSNRFDVGTDGTNMEFNVRDTGAFTFGGGNVGIGTSSPASYSGYTTLGINGTNGGVVDLMVGGVRKGSIYNTNSGNTLALDSPTGTNIAFLVNGAERAAVTENGITFNGDTAAANALDDYEEGTWTPVISDGTNNATMTATYNEGKYVKVGKIVHLSAYVLTDSLGSVTGNINITGLPFSNSSGFGFLVGGVAGAGGNLNLTSGQNITLTISTGSNYIILNVWDATTGSNPMTASQWSADGQIQIGITYLAS